MSSDNVQEIHDKKIIHCECGCHLLMVQSDTEVRKNLDKTTSVYQAFYLAMFTHGTERRSIWQRLKIAWGYLRTGKTFRDQMVLTPTEAAELSDFIHDNIYLPEETETTLN